MPEELRDGSCATLPRQLRFAVRLGMTLRGLASEVGTLALVVFMVPVVVIVIGAPIVLFVRLVIEIAHRL